MVNRINFISFLTSIRDEKMLEDRFVTHPLRTQLTRIYSTPALPHKHSIYELVTFRKGLSQNVVNGKVYEVGEGDVFLLGPAHEHAIVPLTNEHSHQDVYFYADDFARLCEFLPEDRKNAFLHGDKHLHLKLDLANRTALYSMLDTLQDIQLMKDKKNDTMLYDFGKALAASTLSFIFGCYLTNSYKKHSAVPAWFQTFLQRLQEPEVFSLRVNDMVKYTNYSHSQVSAACQQYLNTTLIDYLVAIRIQYACDLLHETEFSVSEIADRCGYNSVSSFIRTFRDKVGQSPLQYRRGTDSKED